MSAKTNAPVIIKRKKVVGGDGHHGGAWKVAYADFVTAMMAFFMLMWLLNATTEKQRKGIADYFNPTIPINRISGGGEGSFGGESIFSEQVLAQTGTGATNKRTTEHRQSKGATGADTVPESAQTTQEARSMAQIEDAILTGGGESMASDQALRHIVTRVSDEGLIVEISDLEGSPLFVGLTDRPTPIMTEIAVMVAKVFDLVTNEVAVAGHLAQQPIVLAENPVWGLSVDRAEMVRGLLQAGGLSPDRMQRVAGYADRKPIAADQMAARNNRVEIILLRTKF